MKERSFKEVLTKLLLFMVTSVAGTTVDLLLHWILSYYVFEGNYWGSYWVAPVISFELSTMTNFVIAYYFVWKERITYRGARSFWRHFGAYNAACCGAFAIKIVLMQGLHFLFVSLGWFQEYSFEPVLCNFIAMAISGLFSFYMSEFVIFNKKKPEQ
ncbi:MAG: GtrA family protein [Bacteroidales bacterium]|nr:GtrA family protein [Bacteroidales bacterium]